MKSRKNQSYRELWCFWGQFWTANIHQKASLRYNRKNIPLTSVLAAYWSKRIFSQEHLQWLWYYRLNFLFRINQSEFHFRTVDKWLHSNQTIFGQPYLSVQYSSLCVINKHCKSLKMLQSFQNETTCFKQLLTFILRLIPWLFKSKIVIQKTDP